MHAEKQQRTPAMLFHSNFLLKDYENDPDEQQNKTDAMQPMLVSMLNTF